MSRKPKRKRKQLQKSGQSTPQSQETRATDGKPKLMGQFWTILGTVVGLIGLIALIELSPRLTGASQPPFREEDRIPAFTVTNDGYLKVTKLRATCFFNQINTTAMTATHMGFGGMASADELMPGENFSFRCGSNGVNFLAPVPMIKSMDVAVVLWYRPWPFTFLRSRKFLRFEGVNTGSKIEWYKQPQGTIEKDYDEFCKITGEKPPD